MDDRVGADGAVNGATDAVRSTWPLGRPRQVRDVAVSGRFTTDDLLVLREAAIAGLGIARLPGALESDAIHTGSLIPLLDEYSRAETPVHLVHLGGRYVTPRTRAFVEFMRPPLARRFEDDAAA